MYLFKFKAFIFLIVGIVLTVGSILGVIEKDYKFALKMLVVGMVFIIASIYERKWIKKNTK